MSFDDSQTLQDLADFISSLPPEEQQAAMVSLGLQQANQVPYTFGGDYQPELGAQAFEGAGYTGGYDQPLLTAKGKVDPRDLAQMAQSTTFAKNREGLLADNVFSAQAGPGAYAAGAFEPTTTYKGGTVDFPGERTLQGLAQTGGWQGAVAQRMLGLTGDGRRRSSAEALGEIRALMESDPAGLDKDTAALQTSIFQSLNAARTSGSSGSSSDQIDAALAENAGLTVEGGGKKKTAPGKDFDWSQYDLPGMQSWADERQMELLKDRPREGLFQDPSTGTYYDQAPEVTPSAQSKWFSDRGLTTPDKSYADQGYQEEVLNRQDPNRPAMIQQEGGPLGAGPDPLTQALGQRFQTVDQTALAFEQELAKHQQEVSDFVARQQAQNAPLPPQTYPERGGVSMGAGRKTAGSMPPDLNQATPLIPSRSRSQLEEQMAAGMSALPEYSSGTPAPTVPRNVQGEPVTPGPGKDYMGQTLPSEQQLTDYYNKTFPTGSMQVDTSTGQSAPVFDFGAGKGQAGGNAQLNEMIAALAAQSGATQPFDTGSGAQKGKIIPGAKTYPVTSGNAAALRGATERARTAYTDQYNQDFSRMYGGNSDFARTYLQRGQMNQMAQQGRTPLNDEIMQRRLLLNALGLYQ